jgi:hypothetical protein
LFFLNIPSEAGFGEIGFGAFEEGDEFREGDIFPGLNSRLYLAGFILLSGREAFGIVAEEE